MGGLQKRRKERKETNAIPAQCLKRRNKYSCLKIQNIRCRDAFNAIQNTDADTDAKYKDTKWLNQ